MRDRSSAPDLSSPFRPLFYAPARVGLSTIGANWHDPRGIGMYWRSKYSNGFITTSYPDWDDFANIVTGPLTPVGGSVSNSKTMNVSFDIAGRVIPFEWIFTVQKITNPGAVLTESLQSIYVFGPGEYTYTFTAPTNGSAVAIASGNKGQFNIPDS